MIEALRAWPDTGITHRVVPITVRGDRLALFAQRSMSANGDEVAIWNRVLTDKQIKSLYGAGAPPAVPTAIHFDDAARDAVAELVGEHP